MEVYAQLLPPKPPDCRLWEVAGHYSLLLLVLWGMTLHTHWTRRQTSLSWKSLQGPLLMNLFSQLENS